MWYGKKQYLCENREGRDKFNGKTMEIKKDGVLKVKIDSWRNH